MGLFLTVIVVCLLCPGHGLSESQSDRLMQQWTSRKMRIKNEILNDLQRQGIHLPGSGSLMFEALIKPNPGSDAEIIYEIRQLEVLDQTVSNSTDQFRCAGNATVMDDSGTISGTIHLMETGTPGDPYKETLIHIGPIHESE